MIEIKADYTIAQILEAYTACDMQDTEKKLF